jgi:MSHA biogenesis protein MshJ
VNLRAQLLALQNRIDELSLRERGILFFAAIALLYFLWSSLLIAPQEQGQKQRLLEINKIRADIAILEQQAPTIISQHNSDPNSSERREMERLSGQQQELDERIKVAVNGLIAPQEMARALEMVLRKQQQLRFVRIENLGAIPLIPRDPSAATSADAGIYKHTMRIELEGSFHHSRDYLQTLEQLPWKFHWESVELTMLDYPLARVVITVNTLSLNEGWLGV